MTSLKETEEGQSRLEMLLQEAAVSRTSKRQAVAAKLKEYRLCSEQCPERSAVRIPWEHWRGINRSGFHERIAPSQDGPASWLATLIIA